MAKRLKHEHLVLARDALSVTKELIFVAAAAVGLYLLITRRNGGGMA